jgi:hypothetical protein
MLGEIGRDERAARHDLEPAAAHFVQHAFDELRSDAAAARRDRRLGVRQRHDIAGALVNHERGDPAGLELEAGEGGVVADRGGHGDNVGWVERRETHREGAAREVLHSSRARPLRKSFTA